MSERDRLFETTITEPGEFVFDERVVRVFPDMINRSVPGYATVVSMTAMLARRYAQPNTRIYDLGCSLGAVTLAMRAAVRAEAVDVFGSFLSLPRNHRRPKPRLAQAQRGLRHPQPPRQ